MNDYCVSPSAYDFVKMEKGVKDCENCRLKIAKFNDLIVTFRGGLMYWLKLVKFNKLIRVTIFMMYFSEIFHK